MAAAATIVLPEPTSPCTSCEALGVEVITRPVSTVENGLVRHNPGHLAWELVRLHAQRNIRLVEDSLRRTPRNRVEK